MNYMEAEAVDPGQASAFESSPRLGVTIQSAAAEGPGLAFSCLASFWKPKSQRPHVRVMLWRFTGG